MFKIPQFSLALDNCHFSSVELKKEPKLEKASMVALLTVSEASLMLPSEHMHNLTDIVVF